MVNIKNNKIGNNTNIKLLSINIYYPVFIIKIIHFFSTLFVLLLIALSLFSLSLSSVIIQLQAGIRNGVVAPYFLFLRFNPSTSIL